MDTISLSPYRSAVCRMTSLPAIDVTKNYGEREALRGVSFQIIATLRVPSSGVVLSDGRDTATGVREARWMIGLTPQSNALDPLSRRRRRCWISRAPRWA